MRFYVIANFVSCPSSAGSLLGVVRHGRARAAAGAAPSTFDGVLMFRDDRGPLP